MAKKFSKFLAGTALLGAAVLGGIAYYKKSRNDSSSLDDDFDDFQDEFEDDDEENDTLKDDFSSVDRGYVTLPKDHAEKSEMPNESEDPEAETSASAEKNSEDSEEAFVDDDYTLNHSVEDEDEEEMLDDPDPETEQHN